MAGGKSVADSERLKLLRSIRELGSISAAARANGISYRTAWLAVEALNNLAGEVLVERTTGGVHGGGAHLSATGLKVLENYDLLRERQRRLIGQQPQPERDHLELLQALGLQTSARNALRTRLHAATFAGSKALLQLQMSGGQDFRALITRQSYHNLELQPGQAVIAMIKATAITLGPLGSSPPLAHYNRLEGTIQPTCSTNPDDPDSEESTLQLPDGLVLYGVMQESAGAILAIETEQTRSDPAGSEHGGTVRTESPLVGTWHEENEHTSRPCARGKPARIQPGSPACANFDPGSVLILACVRV